MKSIRLEESKDWEYMERKSNGKSRLRWRTDREKEKEI